MLWEDMSPSELVISKRKQRSLDTPRQFRKRNDLHWNWKAKVCFHSFQGNVAGHCLEVKPGGSWVQGENIITGKIKLPYGPPIHLYVFTLP